MAVEHKDLTGAQLHEPKGAATAVNDSVYVANGSGSGSWLSRFTGIFKPVNRFNLVLRMPDVGAANQSVYFALPFKCRVVGLKAVINDVAVGDSILTVRIGGSPLATETLTLTAAASFAGKVFSRTITTNLTDLSLDSMVEVRTDGGATNSFYADIYLICDAVS